jgi:hypothetical protein
LSMVAKRCWAFPVARGPNTRNRCSDMWEKEIQTALVDFHDRRAAAFLFCALMCVIWTFRYFWSC